MTVKDIKKTRTENIYIKARRIVSLALAVVLSISSYVYFYNDGYAFGAVVEVKGNTKFYKWHRVNSDSELKAAIKTDYDGKESDRQLDGSDGWRRVMFVYGNNFADSYIIAGVRTEGSEDDKEYVGRSIYSTDGIFASEEEFTTIQNFDCPYIKYAGNDGDNSNNGKYFLKFSDDRSTRYDRDTEGHPSQNAIRWLQHQDNLHGGARAPSSWYITLEVGPGKNVNGSKYNDHWYFGSYTRYDCFTIDWGSNWALLYYNVKKQSDAYCQHSGSHIWLKSSTTATYSKCSYKVFIAELVDMPCIDSNTVYEGGTYNVLKDTMIKEGITVTVTDGATLVLDHMDSTIKNLGRIVVDGGATLIVNYDTVVDYYPNAEAINGIFVNSFVVKDGQFIVLDGAAVISPYTENATAIEVQSNGTLYNRGRIMTANMIHINGGQFYNAGDAVVKFGFEAKDDEDMSFEHIGKYNSNDHVSVKHFGGILKFSGNYVFGCDNVNNIVMPAVMTTNACTLAGCTNTGLKIQNGSSTDTYYAETISQGLTKINSGIPNTERKDTGTK